MWPARRGRPRYIGGLALTRIAAWLAVHRRQLLQRAEDDARGRRRCAEDETMRTTTALSRRQVGTTRRAGIFLAVSRAFLSSGVPERAPEGRRCLGLAGWIRPKSRRKRESEGATGPIFTVRMKKMCAGASPDSWLEMLLSIAAEPSRQVASREQIRWSPCIAQLRALQYCTAATSMCQCAMVIRCVRRFFAGFFCLFG
jgi:hypothetical protein